MGVATAGLWKHRGYGRSASLPTPHGKTEIGQIPAEMQTDKRKAFKMGIYMIKSELSKKAQYLTTINYLIRDGHSEW